MDGIGWHRELHTLKGSFFQRCGRHRALHTLKGSFPKHASGMTFWGILAPIGEHYVARCASGVRREATGTKTYLPEGTFLETFLVNVDTCSVFCATQFWRRSCEALLWHFVCQNSRFGKT